MKTVRVFKLTDDDWYPSYKIGGYYRGNQGTQMVEVSFLQFLDKLGYRVCVWGGDDCGMEVDFDKTQLRKAKEVFMDVISLDRVNRSTLKQMGFQNA